jgi:hypothetical protein
MDPERQKGKNKISFFWKGEIFLHQDLDRKVMNKSKVTL